VHDHELACLTDAIVPLWRRCFIAVYVDDDVTHARRVASLLDDISVVLVARGVRNETVVMISLPHMRRSDPAAEAE
jgi:hypothetical protein